MCLLAGSSFFRRTCTEREAHLKGCFALEVASPSHMLHYVYQAHHVQRSSLPFGEQLCCRLFFGGRLTAANHHRHVSLHCACTIRHEGPAHSHFAAFG